LRRHLVANVTPPSWSWLLRTTAPRATQMEVFDGRLAVAVATATATEDLTDKRLDRCGGWRQAAGATGEGTARVTGGIARASKAHCRWQAARMDTRRAPRIRHSATRHRPFLSIFIESSVVIFLVKSQSGGVHYWKTVRRNRKNENQLLNRYFP
jgi:hypothetical protein